MCSANHSQANTHTQRTLWSGRTVLLPISMSPRVNHSGKSWYVWLLLWFWRWRCALLFPSRLFTSLWCWLSVRLADLVWCTRIWSIETVSSNALDWTLQPSHQRICISYLKWVLYFFSQILRKHTHTNREIEKQNQFRKIKKKCVNKDAIFAVCCA